MRKNTRKGTAKLAVTVPGPGELELARTGNVKGASERAEPAGKVKLPVKPKGKARKQLRRDGSAMVRAEVIYTPDGAGPNTQSKTRKKLDSKGKAKVNANVTYAPTGGSPNTEDKKIKLVKR